LRLQADKSAFLDARIVIVTVCKGDDMREAADEGGASAFVVKDDLLELRQILSDRATGLRSVPAAS
jgi:hypothetical protein